MKRLAILWLILVSCCGCGDGETSDADAPDQPLTEVDLAPTPSHLSPNTASIQVAIGVGAGFGTQDKIFGPPSATTPVAGSTDVYSLGDGGSIVIDLGAQSVLLNGPGTDFIVHENVFLIGGDPKNPYVEVAVVSVSQDGKTWVTFPYDYNPQGKATAERFHGFAGVTPEGDGFDLALVGLSWARFIRIVDAGSDTADGDSRVLDGDGDFIADSGNACCGAGTAGFDLDAITLLYRGPKP